MKTLNRTIHFLRQLSPLICLGGLLVMVLSSPAQAANARVVPELVFVDGSPHASFVQKLKATLQTVTEKALKDQKDWADQKKEFETIIQDVLERAYRGYRVEKVSLSKEGDSVRAQAKLKAFGDTIKAVAITPEIQPLPEFISPLLKPELKTATTRLETLWKGLPLQNLVWARGLMSDQVLEALKSLENLSFFTPTVELKAEKTVQVRLVLRPRAPLLKTIGLGLESTLLPNVLLDDIRIALIPTLVDLRGLPIGLVKANTGLLFKPMDKAFKDLKIVHRLKLKTELRPTFTTQGLQLRARIFSPRFRLMASGQLDVGRNNQEGRLDGHLGVMMGKHVEVFVEPAIEVEPVRLVGDLGVMAHPTDWLRVGVGRDLEYNKDKWWASLDLAPQFGLSYESRAVRGLHRELGLWYKPNEFYRFGLYHDLDDDLWLRLKANL